MAITNDLRCPSEKFVTDNLYYFHGPQDLPSFIERLAKECCAAVVKVCLQVGPGRARSLLVWEQGAFVETSLYNLRGSLCAKVIATGKWVVQDDLDTVLPDSDLVRRLGLTSYIGIPIIPVGGKPVGALYLVGHGRVTPSWDTGSAMHMLEVGLGSALGSSFRPARMHDDVLAGFACEATRV